MAHGKYLVFLSNNLTLKIERLLSNFVTLVKAAWSSLVYRSGNESMNNRFDIIVIGFANNYLVPVVSIIINIQSAIDMAALVH